MKISVLQEDGMSTKLKKILRYLSLYLGKTGARRADVFAWMASAAVTLLVLCRPSERGFYLGKLNQYMP